MHSGAGSTVRDFEDFGHACLVEFGRAQIMPLSPKSRTSPEELLRGFRIFMYANTHSKNSEVLNGS